MIQSDVEGDFPAPSRKCNVAHFNSLDLPELRVPPLHVVQVAGGDLVTEVQLAGEGLALRSWRHHLNISQNKIVQKSMLARLYTL